MSHPLEGKRTPYIALRCGDATTNEQTLATDEMQRLRADIDAIPEEIKRRDKLRPSFFER